MEQSTQTIEVFKTDITKKKVARMLLRSLSTQFPGYKINIDMADCDKVLRVASEYPFDAEQVLRFVKGQHVQIEILSW